MASNAEISTSTESTTAKNITVKKVLNLYGVFAFIGLIVSVFTNPISGIENMRFIYDDELKLSASELQEFLLFVLIVAPLYFFLINVHDLGEIWRKAVLVILSLISIISIVLIFSSKM